MGTAPRTCVAFTVFLLAACGGRQSTDSGLESETLAYEPPAPERVFVQYWTIDPEGLSEALTVDNLVVDRIGHLIVQLMGVEGVAAALEAPITADPAPSIDWIASAQVALAVDNLEALGEIGRATVQRVAWFQLVNNLPPTGQFDDDTVEFLNVAFPHLHPDPDCYDGTEPFYPACLLEWPGASREQESFMRDVYERQCERSARSRQFTPFIEHTTWIEDRYFAESAVTDSVRQLLVAARAEQPIYSDLLPTIGVSSAYRSAIWQLLRWDNNFRKYYRDATVAAETEAMDGGRHGRDAENYLARYTSARFAAPGFSLHNIGAAIDFECIDEDDGEPIRLDTSDTDDWEDSWCYEWLVDNAATYGFAQNDGIDEPWHWEFVESPVPMN